MDAFNDLDDFSLLTFYMDKQDTLKSSPENISFGSRLTSFIKYAVTPSFFMKTDGEQQSSSKKSNHRVSPTTKADDSDRVVIVSGSAANSPSRNPSSATPVTFVQRANSNFSSPVWPVVTSYGANDASLLNNGDQQPVNNTGPATNTTGPPIVEVCGALPMSYQFSALDNFVGSPVFIPSAVASLSQAPSFNGSNIREQPLLDARKRSALVNDNEEFNDSSVTKRIKLQASPYGAPNVLSLATSVSHSVLQPQLKLTNTSPFASSSAASALNSASALSSGKDLPASNCLSSFVANTNHNRLADAALRFNRSEVAGDDNKSINKLLSSNCLRSSFSSNYTTDFSDIRHSELSGKRASISYRSSFYKRSVAPIYERRPVLFSGNDSNYFSLKRSGIGSTTQGDDHWRKSPNLSYFGYLPSSSAQTLVVRSANPSAAVSNGEPAECKVTASERASALGMSCNSAGTAREGKEVKTAVQPDAVSSASSSAKFRMRQPFITPADDDERQRKLRDEPAWSFSQSHLTQSGCSTPLAKTKSDRAVQATPSVSPKPLRDSFVNGPARALASSLSSNAFDDDASFSFSKPRTLNTSAKNRTFID